LSPQQRLQYGELSMLQNALIARWASAIWCIWWIELQLHLMLEIRIRISQVTSKSRVKEQRIVCIQTSWCSNHVWPVTERRFP
jgi:hypothetical protein